MRGLCIAVAVACLWGLVARAEARLLSAAEVAKEQAAALDTREMEGFLRSLDAGLAQELPPFELRALIAGEASGTGFSVPATLRRLLIYLAREVVANSYLLSQLVVLAVLCAVLRSVMTAWPAHGAADLAFAVCFLALLYLALQSFRAAVDVAEGTITTMVDFMHALLPLMTTMLAAVGAVTTATVFHPLLFTVANLVATIVRSVLLPLVFLSAALAVLGSLSKEFPMKKLAGTIRQWTLTVLGLLFILFFGVLTIRGAIAPVTDGMALKTAKFLTGSFIPVVGSRMAEALDVVVGGSLLIKNAVGVFGMVAVFLIVAFPALKVLSVLMIYRLATALLEPISDERLIDAMSALATSLSLVLACLLTVGLMFFVGITVLVGLGNVPAYVR
jgi:stage III sporulation protein AE